MPCWFLFRNDSWLFNTAAITRAQLEDKTFGTASIAPGQKETEVRGTGQRWKTMWFVSIYLYLSLSLLFYLFQYVSISIYLYLFYLYLYVHLSFYLLIYLSIWFYPIYSGFQRNHGSKNSTETFFFEHWTKVVLFALKGLKMIPLFQLLKQMFKASSPRTGHSIAKVTYCPFCFGCTKSCTTLHKYPISCSTVLTFSSNMPDYTNNWCFEKKKHLGRLNHLTIYDILTLEISVARKPHTEISYHWGAGNSPALHPSRASSLCNGALYHEEIDVIFQQQKPGASTLPLKVSKTHGFTGCFCFS